MVQASNGTLITVIIIGLLALGALVYFTQPEIPTPPTAAEIASQIVIPEVVIPEVVIPSTDNSIQQEIWDEIYKDEVEELEEDGLRICSTEFKLKKVRDLYDNVHSIRFEDFDEDDYDMTIIDLGLDDEDDREVVFDGFFTISYLPDEGQQIRVNDKIYGDCVVTSDEGDLEADVTLSL